MNKDNVTRREFLGITSSAIGAISLSGLSSTLGWAENIVKVDFKNIKETDKEVDVLVIGSGMAGLFAAVKAHDAGAKVLMVSKGGLGTSGQTPFAKGIFSYDEKNEKLVFFDFYCKKCSLCFISHIYKSTHISLNYIF